MTKKERIAELERQVAGLRQELDALRAVVLTVDPQRQPPLHPDIMPTYPQPHYPWYVVPTTTGTWKPPADWYTSFTIDTIKPLTSPEDTFVVAV